MPLLLLLLLQLVLLLLPSSSYYSNPFLRQHQGRLSATADPLILEGLPLVLERRSRPEHVQFSRRRMELPFAVLLMRSSYQAVEKLKFVPTDEFQKSFFLFRQSEWEDYRSHHANLMQGDLTDPLYFDHVSFAQYAVISDKMRRGKQSFIQLIDANGTAESVQRSALLQNNDLLPRAHSRIVGDAILDYIVNTYTKIIPAGLPLSNSTATDRAQFKTDFKATQLAPFEVFTKACQDILDTLEINSYALNMKVEALPEKIKALNSNTALLRVRIVGPATLWGSQVLRQRGDLVNDFEIKVLDRLADRYGITLEVLTTSSTSADTTYVCRAAFAPPTATTSYDGA